MILSNKNIIDYIESGKLEINPFDKSRVYPASYKFTLGKNLLRPYGNDLIDFEKGLIPEYEEIEIGENGYILQPGEFILGQTLERLTLNPGIVMIIEGRTTLARVGIEVVQTSTFIEPNHTDSIITLEIKNNGKNPFMLRTGMPFAKGYFLTLISEYEKGLNEGLYVTQDEVEGPKVS